MVVSVRKNNDIRFYVILLIIQIILSIIYAIYIVIDERKKWQKREPKKSAQRLFSPQTL